MTLPFDHSCPVLYDNDDHRDVYTDELLLALSHLGRVELRGFVTTYAEDLDEYNEFVAGRERIVSLARESGLRNLPPVIAGTEQRLRMPDDRRIESTQPLGLDAAELIIGSARRATETQPLLIVCGGQLTTVAEAVLRAPDIAERVVVAGLFATTVPDWNSMLDPWAWTIVLAKCRVFAVPFGVEGERGTVFLKGARCTKERILRDLPQSIPLFRWMHEKRHPSNGGPGDFDGDGHVVLAMLEPDYITNVKRYRFAGVNGQGKPSLTEDAEGAIWEAVDADEPIGTRVFWEVFQALKRETYAPAAP